MKMERIKLVVMVSLMIGAFLCLASVLSMNEKARRDQERQELIDMVNCPTFEYLNRGGDYAVGACGAKFADVSDSQFLVDQVVAFGPYVEMPSPTIRIAALDSKNINTELLQVCTDYTAESSVVSSANEREISYLYEDDPVVVGLHIDRYRDGYYLAVKFYRTTESMGIGAEPDLDVISDAIDVQTQTLAPVEGDGDFLLDYAYGSLKVTAIT